MSSPSYGQPSRMAHFLRPKLISTLFPHLPGDSHRSYRYALGLGSAARMNVPSLEDGNWRWRFDSTLLRSELAKKLAVLVEVSDRLPLPMAVSKEDWAT